MNVFDRIILPTLLCGTEVISINHFKDFGEGGKWIKFCQNILNVKFRTPSAISNNNGFYLHVFFLYIFKSGLKVKKHTIKFKAYHGGVH